MGKTVREESPKDARTILRGAAPLDLFKHSGHCEGTVFPPGPEQLSGFWIISQKSGFNTVSGRFHVKGPRKKVNVKKWIFFMKCER